MKMKWTVEKKMLLGVLVAVAVLLVNANLSYRAANRVVRNEQWVIHTHQVIAELGAILSTMKDAEIGKRGYVVTGQESYLQSYQSAVEQIHSRVEKLQQLTADNPNQQARMPELERLIAVRIDSLSRGIELRRKGEIESARQQIFSQEGKQQMDNLRGLIASMEGDEQDLLTLRAAESKSSQSAATLTFLIANLVAGIFLFLVAYILLRDLGKRREAEAALAEQREWLRVMLASIGDAIIATDTGGAVTFMNQVAESLTGWRQEEAFGKPLEKVFHIVNEASREAVENPALRAIQEGVIVGLANHTVLIAKDGREIPLDDSGAPIKDDGGNIIGAVLVFRDVTEHKQAEKSLRESEERLQLALVSANTGIHVYNIADNTLFWDDRMRELWGIGKGEPVDYDAFINGLHPDDRERTRAAVDDALDPKGGGKYDAEYRVIGKNDKKVRWISATGQVFFENGNPIRLVGTARDITEHKEAEQQISAQRRLYKSVTDNATTALFIMDERQQCVFMNPAAEMLTGHTLAETQGRPLHDVVHHTHPDGTPYPLSECPIDTAFPTRNQMQGEEVFVHKDGHFYDVAFTASPLLDEHGKPVGTVIEVQDITERKKAEEALRLSEHRYRTIVEAVSAVTWNCPPSGLHVVPQPSWVAFTGQTAEEMLGAGWTKAVHPEDAAAAGARWNEAVTQGKPYASEHRIRRHDGEWRWMRVEAAPVRDADGKIVDWFGINFDITERKEAEEALREQKQFTDNIIQAAPSLIYIYDFPTSSNIFISPQTLDVLGYTATEIGAMGAQILATLLHPDDAPSAAARLERLLADRGDAIFEAEYRMRHKSGEWVWLFDRARVFRRDAEGKPTQILGVTTDITERKRAEAERETAQARYRAVGELIPFGVWEADPEGNPVYLSRMFLDMTGLTLEEFRRTWQALLHEEDQATVREWRECVKGRREWHREFQMLGADGEYYAILARGMPVFDANGEVLSYVGVNFDVTERRRAEEALRQNQRTFTDLVERAPFGIYVVDSQFRIAHMNTGSQAGTFRNVRPVIGRDFGEAMRILWSEEVAAEIISRFRHTLETGIPYYSPRFTHERHDVRAVESYEWELHRVVLHDGRHGVICYYYDSTALRQAQQAAEDANRAKDEFLAMLSHELRTPLNAMYGWTHMLQSGRLDAEKTEVAIDVIARNVKLQNALIEDLLDVSRIVSGKILLEHESLSLLWTVQEAVEAARPAAEKRRITIETALDSAADRIFADQYRLQQIINNLLTNAIKFTPEGGAIRVTLERDGNTATLQVRDSGVGIAPELLPHIFERFRQANASVKRKYGGLGLGLTIVKHLVEMHGGTVAVHSEGENRGATFTVILPLVPQTVMQPIPETAADGGGESPGKALAGIRILLVDDDADALEMLCYVLRAEGASITCARSAREALEEVTAQEYDLLISDLGMPEISGYDFIRQVRETLPADKLPAIALTGYVSPEDRERVLQAGFQTHVPKPVEIERLPLVVLSVTRNRQRTLAQS